MFPGANAQVYYNEAGEPIGWDYPPDPEDIDPYDDDNPERPFECKCGVTFWPDDEDEIVSHYENCDEPAWFYERFADFIPDPTHNTER